MHIHSATRGCLPLIPAALLVFVLGCTSALAADPGEYAVVEQVKIGGPGGWDFITFDPARQRLFIARGDRVQVWSAGSRLVLAEIAGTAGVHGVALSQDLNRGFASNGRANSITVFDLDTLQVVKTIAIAGANPDAILYDAGSKRVYCFNGRSASMTVIDAASLQVLADVALGGKPEVAVSDGAGRVFVNIEDTAEIVVIDQASNKVQARWPLKPCEDPTGLAIDAAHRRLFAVCANRMMVVHDAESGRQVASVPIGGSPDGAGFDPALGLAFSSNGEGTLTLVHQDDLEHYSVAANVPTQARARTMALDPVSHRVYLVSASFGSAPAPTAGQPKPRPPMIPDSFTVLVLAPK
jgi:YVTN family beta-propeller protein